MIPEFTDTIRGEISVEGSPPDPEVIDDIPDKRVAHRVLASDGYGNALITHG
jgi:hypothetical protein